MKLSAKKIILFSLLGTVLFFVTAIVLAVIFIDPNDYKQKIQTELSGLTGYDITIPGKIKLEFFPQLNLALEQIKLTGSKSGQNLSVDTQKLNLKINLLSLFSGEPKIGTVIIAKSIIRTATTTAPHVLTNIAFTSSGFKPDQQTNIDIKLNYHTPNKTVLPLKLHSDLLYKRADKSIHLTKINFTIQMLRLTGDTHITPVDSQYQITGTIKSQEFSPRELATLIGVNLPAMHDKNALEKFSLASKYHYINNSLKLDSLITVFDKTTLSGNLSVLLKPGYPVYFDLAADVLNVDDYRPVPTSNTNSANKDNANPLVILGANLNGEVRLASMVFNNLKTQDNVLKFARKNNTMTITPSAKLYGGTFKGMVHLATKNNAIQLNGEQTLTQVNMGQLLVDYMGDKLVSGISDLDIKFSANGSTADVLLKNMIASGKVKITDAQLMSIKLARSILQDSKLNKLIKNQDDNKEITAFDILTASFTIKNAIATNNDLSALSTRARVTGAGNINLAAQTLDYVVNYFYNKSHIIHFNGIDIDLKDKAIPIHLSGSLNNPQYDIKSKVFLDTITDEYKKSAKYQKLDQKKQNLEDKKHNLEDKVKNKLKDLFN